MSITKSAINEFSLSSESNGLLKVESIVIDMQPSATYGLSRFINETPPFKITLNIETARQYFSQF